MRRMLMVLALAATMLLASASMAIAGPNENADCDEALGSVNHGAHITNHYVNNEENVVPGVRGRAAHFGGTVETASPGASFCQGENEAPSLLGNPGRFVR